MYQLVQYIFNIYQLVFNIMYQLVNVIKISCSSSFTI